MPYRPNFPIPEDINAPKYCICIEIPNEPTYKSVFAGLIYELTYWFNWERTDGNEGAQCANVWKEIYNSIDWSIMSCCCGEDNSVLHRYTPNGHYQKSNDGGTTWEDAPEDDPRNPQPFYPPNLPPEGENNKCQYADSVVQLMKTQLVDVLEEGSTYSEILQVVTGAFATIMGALAPTVLGAIIVGIMGAVIVGIIGVSIPLFVAAMTVDVYNRFRCNLFCHMQADGSFTQADVDAIYEQIAEDETGIAMIFLQGFVAAAGMIGLSNAAHAGFGAEDADCSACCPVCGINWVAYEGYGDPLTFGTDETGNYVQGTAVNHSGTYYFIIHSPGDNDDCCVLTTVTNEDGTEVGIAGTLYIPCGEPKAGTYVNFTGEDVPCNEVQVQCTSAVVVRVYLG